MAKNAKRFFSMLLALSLLFSLAVPATAAEEHDHDHAGTTAATNASGELTVSTENITLTADDIEFELSFNPMLVLSDPDVEVDENDPAIIAFKTELENITVLDEATQEPVPLTPEQIQVVLGMYQQYLDHWTANANILGLQTPFFLSYNDNGEDGLGILGEMLALAGVPVAAVRAGAMSYDDLTGMIQNFLYGDMLGVQLYGQQIAAARDEVLALVESSGALTEEQKLLVVNDWLAHNVTFDMPYIMNTGKENPPMVAETPVEHEYYQVVYDVIYEAYLEQLTNTFEQQIVGGLRAQMMQQFYIAAIEQGYYQGVYEAALGAAAEEALPAIEAVAKQEIYNEVYASEQEAAEQEIYDEAYAEYIAENHEHAYTAVFTWTESETGEWTATATVTCTEGGEVHENLEATVVKYDEVSTAATCTEAGEDVFVATVEIEDVNGEVQIVDNIKRISVDALGHQYNNETGVCSVCGATSASHEHTYTVEFTWNFDETTGDVATVDVVGTCSTCGNEEEQTATLTPGARTEATCTADGAANYTASAVIGGNTYTETEEAVLNALGHNYVEGVCAVCGEAESVETETVAENTTLNASAELEAAAAAYAEAAVEAAAEEIAAQADAAATATAEAYVEENAEALLQRAKDAVETDAEAKAQLEAAAKSATEDFMTENETAINADPVAFCETAFGAEAAAGIAQQWEATWADWEANGIPGMVSMFKQPIYEAIIEQFYIQGMVQQGMTEEAAATQAAAIMEADAAAIAADPYAYCVEKFGETGAAQAEAAVNNQLTQMGIDASAETNPQGRVKLEVIVAIQMDTPQQDPMLQKPDGSYMTPNEAVPVFADQAAVGLTGGVLNYWQGSHFGALGRGTAVCLGYTKAFTYLVQCLHPEVYGINGAETDMSVSENWKTRDQVYVYNEDGTINIDANYIVDAIRITFDAEVTMFGQKEDNFNSDHFWNAVKVDGQWYYVDPCYIDVFTEVMMRDRVETDGQMNHLYFLFSHTAAAQLYDGNYAEIKTLYESVATDTSYEDSWMSRIASNTYFADGYAYYLYESTDMLTLMDEYENQITESTITESVYKIVRHQLTTTDAGTDGDEDYETLIIFNYQADEDSDPVARVWDPETKAMVDNALLTELYAKHAAYAQVYPSLAITAALYEGKVYFNLANCILSYDVATNEIAVVKEYNTVYGVRDDTNPFGGMAFTTTTADNADFTVENNPIAGLTIKPDGNMYVSVATNFAFISGKADRTDPASEGYGYAYEESNYNRNYNSYMDFGDYDDADLESFGYTREINDNDEFMWTANFVETLAMSHLAGTRHTYEAVTVAPTCGVDGYTENRCTTCGAIEADTRVVDEGTAGEHHYIEYHETFYTKDDGGSWNTGVCYVCTVCGDSVVEPVEPSGMMADDEDAQAAYEEALAIYEAAKASAGHTYQAADPVWARNNSTVTFSAVECSNVCPERKPYLDCLVEDATVSMELADEVEAEASVIERIGLCPDGVTHIYGASGEAETADGSTVAYTATKAVELEPAEHQYVDGVCSVCGDCTVKRVYGDNRVTTALEVADKLKEALGVETFDTIILASGDSFADALAGSYLANVKGAPILLYRASGMEQNLQYITENLSEDGVVYILGGDAAVPASVDEDLADFEVVRLAGDSRFATNLLILEEAGVTDEEILVATGWNFADSLSASATGLPILLVNSIKDELTEEQIAFLEGLEGNKITIIGGNAAVSDKLQADIEEIVGAEVNRVYGETREATSVMLAEAYFEEPTFAVVAYSRNFPDGLAGGPLAYALNAPLLLTNAGQEAVTAEYLAENEIIDGYVLGGTAALTDETVILAFNLNPEAVIK